MGKLYVQYGCGWTAPSTWRNFDASPTLRFERIPVLGRLYTKNSTRFPENVEYGDIVKGLPVSANSCDGVFASHVLEHLALEDFKVALRNSLDLLKPGGVYRVVVPDLRTLARSYVNSEDPLAAYEFMRASYLGVKNRPRGLWGVMQSWLGNNAHLWMWDAESLCHEMQSAGFVDIRMCEFGDASDPIFSDVESRDRFVASVAVEARKPR